CGRAGGCARYRNRARALGAPRAAAHRAYPAVDAYLRHHHVPAEAVEKSIDPGRATAVGGGAVSAHREPRADRVPARSGSGAMTVQLRIAGYQDEPSVHTRAMRVLIAALERRAGDAVRVEFEPNIAARGRKVADLLGLVESGELDLCYFSSSYLSERVPA